MSIEYSSGTIKEQFLDSSSFSQSRCEFRLPNDYSILSNMKLVNLGATATESQGYNRACGVAGLIKNIRLMDGANVLSECRQVAKNLGFRVLNNSNNVIQSFKSPPLLSTNINYSKKTIDEANDVVYKVYQANRYNSAGENLTVDQISTPKGLLVLSDVLPFLSKVSMLDNKVFKNGLRLQIEWETDRFKTTNSLEGSITIIEPVLCLYNVVGMDLYNELKMNPGVMTWFEREVDTRFYDALPSVTQKFNGFDNKKCSRILVAKEYSTGSNYLGSNNQVEAFGKSGSVALLDESMNIINNGVQVFPTDLNADDLARQTVNAFGSVMGHIGFNKPQSKQTGFPDYSVLCNSPTLQPGKLCWNGVKMGNETIKNLQIKLNRNPTPEYSAGNGDYLNVFVFADVGRMLSVSKDGSYVIGYA